MGPGVCARIRRRAFVAVQQTVCSIDAERDLLVRCTV